MAKAELLSNQNIGVVVSLNFHPGHISHLIASYKLLEGIGYRAYMVVNQKFDVYIDSEFRIVHKWNELPRKANLAIFTFPSIHNIFPMTRLKLGGCKILYIFHEPLGKMKIYKNAGFTSKDIFKLRLGNVVETITVMLADSVLLPSRKAVAYYDANGMYWNKNRHYIPLLFDDEYTEEYQNCGRLYFSYIGTIASDHSFNEYLSFIEWAVKEEKLPELRFLIATKSVVDRNDRVKQMVETGRLTIIDSHPLSNEEINRCYASSVAVWNAYERTTQSGVLAKSFMFGTPVILLKKNVSEFTDLDRGVIAIDDNKSYHQILNAIEAIIAHFDSYSAACRTQFLQKFYYSNYCNLISSIL